MINDLHITKKVLGKDDTIELPWARDDNHGCRIDQVVVQRQLWIFAFDRLGNNLPPQPGRSEYVRLVDRVNSEWRVGSERDLSSDTGNAFDLLNAIDHRVPCGVWLRLNVLFFPWSKVSSSDKFTNNNHINALGNFSAQRGVVDERFRSEVCRTDVGVEAEGFAESEQSGFRTDFRIDTPFRSTNGSC